MLAQFSTFPVGSAESLSSEVAKVLEIINASGLPYKLNPMGTVVEGDWDAIMALIKNCHHALRNSNHRVYTTITIDDREGALDRIHGKIKSLEQRTGKIFST